MSETPDGTAFDVAGPDDAPVLLFIHGLGLCREIWHPLLPAFADYRTVIYDLYGHGDSAPPPRSASLSVYAVQIAALMDHLGIAKASLIGFSIGGMINRRFALDYPDRLDRLAILNSPHDRGAEAQAAVEARAAAVRSQGAMSTMETALARWFTPECLTAATANPDAPLPERFTPGTPPAQVIQWRNRVEAESYAQAAWVLAHGVRELTGRDGQISHPTLVMTGENDTGSTPAMSQDIAAEISGAHVEIVQALQHLGVMEDPAAFTGPVLEFLTHHR